jgi:glycosyltransferase involved in cell wall biosynthesis
MRLAFFVDQIFWRDGDVLSTNEAYILFLAKFADHANQIILIGRLAPEPGRAPYVVDNTAISFCPLPYYPSLHQLWRAPPLIYRQIRRTVRRHAPSWDLILISGPNPIGQMIARQCIAAGVPVALVVRQNLVEQQKSIYPGIRGFAAVPIARALERDFKRLARGRTVFTVGMEMTLEYRSVSDRVHEHFACLIDDEQLKELSAVSLSPNPGRLLYVGRLSPEKGLVYLLKAIVMLKSRGVSCHLDIVGSGALENELKAMVGALGISEQVTFHGYIPFGPGLLELYRRSEAFVLPSLTEGFPQVIVEALSVGLPAVATAVGGIPAFLADGETAMLVAPEDVHGLAGAVEKVVRDGALRERLRRNGQALIRHNTLDVNCMRIMRILREEVLEHRH